MPPRRLISRTRSGRGVLMPRWSRRSHARGNLHSSLDATRVPNFICEELIDLEVEAQARARRYDMEQQYLSKLAERICKAYGDQLVQGVIAEMDSIEAEATKEANAPITPMPVHARASLLGLPAELRLGIYNLLWETAQVHVHSRTSTGEMLPSAVSEDHAFRVEKLTWTPCLAVDPHLPCLCARPVWDGTSSPEQRCSDLTSRVNEPTGIFALRWTCKTLRRELGDAHRYKPVVSLESADLYRFTSSTPKTVLDAITRLRLAGNRHRYGGERDHTAHQRHFLLSVPYGSRNPFANIQEAFPRLKTVALQGFFHRRQAAHVLAELVNLPCPEIDPSLGIWHTSFETIITSFSHNTTVILDISYRPKDRKERDGLADTKRFVVTRPAVETESSLGELDWATCEVRFVPFAREALQSPPQIR